MAKMFDKLKKKKKNFIKSIFTVLTYNFLVIA